MKSYFALLHKPSMKSIPNDHNFHSLTRKYLLLLVLLCFSTLAVAQQATDASQLTLERIFSSNEFSLERFGPARWIDNGKGYTTLEPNADNANVLDIVRYETSTGERENIRL